MRWSDWRRSDKVEDYRDPNKPVEQPDLSEFYTSINKQIEITNSTLAQDAGANAIGSMKLIPNWKKAHKFSSIQLGLLSAVFSGLWVALPAFQELLPPLKFAGLCIVVSLIACVLRLIHQPAVHDDE